MKQQAMANPIIGRVIKKVEQPEVSNANNSRFLERKEKVNKVATKHPIGNNQDK
jgi:hypothetical protein